MASPSSAHRYLQRPQSSPRCWERPFNSSWRLASYMGCARTPHSAARLAATTATASLSASVYERCYPLAAHLLVLDTGRTPLAGTETLPLRRRRSCCLLQLARACLSGWWPPMSDTCQRALGRAVWPLLGSLPAAPPPSVPFCHRGANRVPRRAVSAA